MAMARGVQDRLVAALVVFAVSVCVRVARAQDAVELEWSAPAECPDREAVLRSIAARLPGPQPSAAVKASARVSKKDGGYELTLRTERGERQLRAASCPELASSTALILAFIVDPAAAEPAAPAADSSSPEPEPDLADDPLDLTGYVRAEWLVDVGMLP